MSLKDIRTKDVGFKDDHRKTVCVTRRDFLLASSGVVLGAAVPFGCGSDEGQGKLGAGDSEAEGTLWEGTQKVVDLVESVHLADVDHHGEFVDFGTAARFKSTLGGWMSGWDNDTSMNGMTFTWATKSPSRFYFSAQEKTAIDFVIRAKPGGTEYFSVYLNDNPLSRLRFSGDDWQELRVTASPETVLVGENYLKFVYQTAEKKLGNKPASFQVDYVRVIPEGRDVPTGMAFDPPHIANLQQHYKVGDAERKSLVLSLPTAFSYYVEVPKGGKLCFAAGAIARGGAEKEPDTKLTVRATPVDESRPVELFSKDYRSATWREEMVDLSAFGGKFVKLDIVAEGRGGGRMALGEMAIRLSPPKITAMGEKKKNVVVVLVDTLRADKLTAYAKTRVKTPAFGKFVKESTLFERCQAPSNWTKPSCATVLTGLYPDTHKARGHASRVGSSIKLASEIFRAMGFGTGAFIANGYLAKEFGFGRGWTEYVNFIRENKNTEAENVYKKSLDFITANKDKPFFTYIQTIDPHVPYDPPDEDLKLYDGQTYDGPVRSRSTGNLLEDFKRKKVELNARDRRRLEALYDGEITYHDRHFGHFLDGLNQLGVLDDTIIVVCSDHGEEFFDHDSVGHGHSLFQELIHVPLVIRAPGVVPAGKRLTNNVGLADILPTVLAATGVPIPKGMEGIDLLPVANGVLPDPMNAAFASFFSEADDRNLSWAVRKGDFKLKMRGPARTYLYDLSNDPRERVDVDVRYPLALRALRIALGQFIGAPDKHNWNSQLVATQVVGQPKARDEQADMPEDLKQQLRALGYMK
jgi:arylsulfatase A-like enzyme